MMRVLELLFCLLTVALTSLGVSAVGDEKQYLDVTFKKGDIEKSASFWCHASLFGSQVPDNGITSKKLTFEHLCPDGGKNKPPKVNGDMVLTEHTHGCYFVEETFVAQSSGASAAIIINEYYSPETLLMGAPSNNKHTKQLHIPSCMISRHSGNVLKSYGDKGYSMVASLHNGATEHMHLNVDNVQELVYYVSRNQGKDVKTDVVRKNTEVVIGDTYELIAVLATKDDKAQNAGFAVKVTDGFKSDTTWMCKEYSNSMQDDWTKVGFNANEEDGWKSAYQHDMLIWTKSLSTLKVACRGERYAQKITNNGYMYQYISNANTYTNAENDCKTLLGSAAHLASIHSDAENRVVMSLVPQYHARNIWIGVNDMTVEQKFVWTDRSKLDFLSWAPGHPSKTDYDNRDDCVYLDPGLGLWRDISCNAKLPFVCKVVVNDTNDKPDDKDICFYYWDKSGVSAGGPPKVLSGANDGLCMSSSKKSCCSAGFINTYLYPEWKQLRDRITSPTCEHVISEFMCISCNDKQAEFTKVAKHGISMNVCEDTCITMFEACKGEHIFKKNLTDSKTFCKTFNTNWNRYVKLNVVPSESEDCFRIDGLAPKVAKAEPSILNSGDSIKIQFDEQIQIVGGDIEIIAKKYITKTDEPNPDSHSHFIRLSSSAVSLSKTLWTDDTLVLNLNRVDECIIDAKEEWAVRIYPFTLVDMAGNLFQGNVGNPIFFTTTSSHCGGHDSSSSSGGGFGRTFLILTLIACFGAGGYFVYKKRSNFGDLNANFVAMRRSLQQTPSSFPSSGDNRPMEAVDMRTSYQSQEQEESDVNYVRLDQDQQDV